MANCAWAIWKARCELVFNNTRTQAQQIFSIACTNTWEQLRKNGGKIREYLTNSVYYNSITVFCDASWSNDSNCCGIGFIMIKGTRECILAGSTWANAESSLQAEILAIGAAVEQCETWNLKPNRLLSDCIEALKLLVSTNTSDAWRIQRDIQKTQNILSNSPEIELEYCPREINSIADLLANHGRRNPQLSLFHRGADKPRWLKEAIAAAGLLF